MKSGYLVQIAMLSSVASCTPSNQPQEQAVNIVEPALPAPNARPVDQNALVPGELEARNGTALPNPEGPVDPKSAQAATRVLQRYGVLIEQKRFAEAAALWTDAKNARAFADSIKTEGELHRVEILKPGPLEGRAGSIYIHVFVIFYYYGHNPKWGHVDLRRVNDVPGSTEVQRRWHIERIGFDWKGA